MSRVFDCRPSLEDDRPVINFELKENARNDWLTVSKVLDGIEPKSAFPRDIRITVDDPRAWEWDCYFDGGSRGLFSQRFVDVVGSEALQYFSLLPALLNDCRYYFLYCEEPIDCFDRSRARFETFPHDPSRIMDISHYAFVEARLPAGCLFCISEVPDLFATEGVAQKIKASGLKGIRMPELP